MSKLLWVTLLCSRLAGSVLASPPVKVALRSTWSAPLIVEALEAVALENPDAFFPLLTTLTNPERYPGEPLSPEAAYQYTLQSAISNGFLSGPGAQQAVELDLALHAAVPKIQAFYQYHTDLLNSTVVDGKSYVDWYGTRIEDVEALVQLLTHDTIEGTSTDEKQTEDVFIRPKLLAFDHIYPEPTYTLVRPPRTAIFYGTLDSPNFWELHSWLVENAGAHFEYVFRHIPSIHHDASSYNYLTGYGVSLDLKKMDYLVLDDRFESSRGSSSSESSTSIGTTDPIIELLEQYPLDVTADFKAPLTEDELLEIGVQASQLIAGSSDPLQTLKTLSQNFPAYAPLVARRVKVNPEFELELQDNQLLAQGGANMFWLNGATVKEDQISPFGLLRLLRKERATISVLGSLGLSPSEVVELLTHPSIAEAAGAGSNAIVDGMFDASDRIEGEGTIVYWNNLEKDSRYARWGDTLQTLLRQMYPGQMHNLKLNLFNVVLTMDLSHSSSLNFIAGSINQIISRGFPFRWGVVPSVETEGGVQMARLFYWMIDKVGRAKTMKFIMTISQFDFPRPVINPNVDWNLVHSEFKKLVAEEGIDADFISIISGKQVGTEEMIQRARSYTARLGADLASAPQGHAFVNGKHYDLDDYFLRLLQNEAAQQTAFLQEKLYEGVLTQEMAPEISTYFYDLPTTAKRRNYHIYPRPGGLRVFNLIDIFGQAGFNSSETSFLHVSSSVDPLSVFVIGDLDGDEGFAMVKEVLLALEADPSFRLSFIHNPSSADIAESTETRRHISWFVSHMLSNDLFAGVTPRQLLQALGLDVPDIASPSAQAVLSRDSALNEITGGVKLNEVDAKEYLKFTSSSRLVTRKLGLAPGQTALLVNGRLVGPFERGEFTSLDFVDLAKYETLKRAQPIITALNSILPEERKADLDASTLSHIVSLASSVISAIQIPDPSEVGLYNTPPRPRTRGYQGLAGNHTAFQYGDSTTASYHIGVLLDPVSESAQRWSDLLGWLASLPDVFLEVHLNPASYKEIPLKRFYRNGFQPTLEFTEDGLERPAQVLFEGLPVEPIYTLGMDVPQSWLVRPRDALYDLDNIQLGRLAPEHGKNGLEAIYQLDYIVIEGHARESLSNQPPRGLQMELIDGSGHAIDDTQVVANLGYFQFKAGPGVFKLSIREGRGRDIYEMESVGNEGYHSASVAEAGDEVTLTSFDGLVLYPRLGRKPGMELEDVLREPPKAEQGTGVVGNLLSKVTSFFGAKESATTDLVAKGPEQADINIFTVASGLLYERFASIMILSVMRNTNSTVKFWFIENFLSPSFLEFIPHLAKAYNFQYELVTYKWPSFIRPQKEKQRVIWAYKILFLDVLFPMDLKKVIFVDADQIVRADLKELVDLDLHGAPYGYTPMGDDNEEMEGFRFWKTGYWKEFLNGLPYHISALYVIDLVRFRQIAAGDILRGHYQQLSADPNSLANLDQDLPNNLQREIPIFSLPEDWLWCETWCSKDRLDRAKTIDLCQNPLTKEPKLSRARQIPEWEVYDSEIAQFTKKLADQGLIRSQAAAADTNALANAAAASGGTALSLENPEQASVDTNKGLRDEL